MELHLVSGYNPVHSLHPDRPLLSIVLFAALLEPSAFERLRQSKSSVLYALGTVLLAGLSFGAGALVYANRTLSEVDRPPTLFPVAILAVLLAWVLWTFVSYFIGSKLMGGKATYRQLLHALGVCFAPGIVTAAVAIPYAGAIAFSFANFWVLSAGIVAVKETQQVGLRRILVPTILGWLPLPFLTGALLILLQVTTA